MRSIRILKNDLVENDNRGKVWFENEIGICRLTTSSY